MAIRFPLQGILDYTDLNNVGAGSVAGGVAKTFNLTQDTDNVVVKLTASTVGGGISAVYQTSDDGGTTWYDVARTSIVSNSALPEWLSIPVISPGIANTITSVVATGSVQSFAKTPGNAAASTLGSGQVSGMPIMGPVNRIFLRLSGNLTGNSTRVQVFSNSQSPSGQ